MKQLIKAAIVYKATIPTDATTLHNHLASESFTDLLALEIKKAGFVPPTDSCRLVAEFPGGLAFRVRLDEKIIPASALQKETNRLADEIQKEYGRKPGKKHRAELKEQARVNLAARAFARTSAITCFYDIESGFLIVPTTSQKLADTATSLLVHAVGSVKTETINVSGVKHGLTMRLKTWLQSGGDEGFGRFQPRAEVALAQEDRRITVKMGSLEGAREGLEDALSKAFQVTSLGLTLDDETEFRLTENFRLKRIQFVHETTTEDDVFATEAMLEVRAVVAVVTELCTMLAYQEPDGDGEAQAAEGGAE